MTWADMENRLGQLRRQLPSPRKAQQSWERAADVFDLLERQTNEALAAAIRAFASHGQWPSLSPDEKIMLAFRAEWAWMVVTAISQTDVPPDWFPTPPASDTQQWEWALIQIWEVLGFEYLASLLRIVPSSGGGALPDSTSQN